MARRVESDEDWNADLTYYFNNYVSLNQDDKKDSYDTAKSYIDILLGGINAKDTRFGKEAHTVGSASQGLKVGTADEFDVNVRLCHLPKTNWSNDKMPKCNFEDKCGTTLYPRGAPPGMAPSSMKTRMSQWRKYMKFCRIYWARPLPAEPQLICLYIDYLDELQPSTIKNYVGGVTLLHKLNGHDPAFKRAPIVRSKLGIKRLKGGAKKVPTPTKMKFGNQPYISLMNPPPEWSDLSTENTLSPKLVRQRFKSLLKEVVDESKLSDIIDIDHRYHGPAITFQISNVGLDHPIDVDFAPMIETDAGFPYWVQWPHPGTTWPSEKKKRDIRKLGVNLVPKGEEKWLISYSKAEKELRNGIDDETCRVKCHRIMKKIREDVWCKAPVPKGTLTSYHLKNLLFWECEKFPDDNSWSNDQLGTRFRSMFFTLLRYLQEGRLDMFMNREVNLLEDKGREALDKVLTNIMLFKNSPSKYLRPQRC